MRERCLYVENNVGRRFTKAFNLFHENHGWDAVFQHDVHPGMQRPQKGDVWWIEDVSKRGLALLTCDLAIVSTPQERRALQENDGRLVGFANAQYDGWQQLRAITTHWDQIEPELVRGGPVVIKVYAGATPPVVDRLESV